MNQESLKGLPIPYGVRMPGGPEEELKAMSWGWGELGEKPPSQPEHMQVVEKASNGKIKSGLILNR